MGGGMVRNSTDAICQTNRDKIMTLPDDTDYMHHFRSWTNDHRY